jgi:GNAT superfamily N-acetyltransferase
MNAVRENGMMSTLPHSLPIVVRPIAPQEVERIVLRCWPEDARALDRLFARQGTIGMAAWEGDVCAGTLHGYRVELPGGRNADWPAWNDWWSPMAGQVDLGLRGPAWCHACCHVGRTLARAAESDDPDRRYFGRGIGTALCQASVRWAWEQDYAAVLAMGAPAGLFSFAVWAGHLPWTTYARLGFEVAAVGQGSSAGEGASLPAWAEGDSPPEVMAEVRAALATGRPATSFHERLMVFRLRGAGAGGRVGPEQMLGTMA